MFIYRNLCYVPVSEPFYDQLSIDPLFEELFRYAYRGFVPDWTRLSENEGIALQAIWDRFNVTADFNSEYLPGQLSIVMGTQAYSLYCDYLVVTSDPLSQPNRRLHVVVVDNTGQKE